MLLQICPVLCLQWTEESEPYLSEHEFSICAVWPDNQERWMITHYININRTGVTELHLNVSFNPNVEQKCCADSVDVRVCPTNGPDETARSDLNQYTLSPIPLQDFVDGVHLAEVTNLTVPITNSTGLYLAFVASSPGTCIAISRITLFYFVCPKQDKNLISFPEMVAPPTESPQAVFVIPNCTTNAIVTSAPGTQLECGAMGVWQTNGVSCECRRGYYYSKNASIPTCKGNIISNFHGSRADRQSIII